MRYNPEKSKGCFSSDSEESLTSNGLVLVKRTSSLNKPISKEAYLKQNAWGLLTSIDLFDCDPDLLRDGEAIKQYIIELCELIDMKRFGNPVVVRFGADPRVQGYSAVQLIETSCISGHFAEDSNSIYMDIFSCKWYDQEKALEFTKQFFKAKTAEANVVLRGKGIV